MKLHSMTKTPGARHRRLRVGRGGGSGKGKTAGRGHKGQMSRSGAKHKPTFEGGQMPLVRRIPKRGFKNPTRVEYQPVNLRSLASFADNAEVGIEQLLAQGLVSGPKPHVKILGTGDLTIKLVVSAHAFSAAAKSKIEAAGGTCILLGSD